MTPEKILVIRHAEKPDGHGVGGVEPNGQPDVKSLTPRGWQRAGALVQFFMHGDVLRHTPLKRPKHLFAARADQTGDEHSKRPYQTIEPLAAHLKPAGGIDDSIRKEELEKLVGKVMRLDDTVLIAWEHKNIPPMARLLLPKSEKVPNWPENRYDMVWVFDRVDDIWHLTQVPQLLLAGDSAELFT
ncbi:histidine phosphatase family protein [Bradyrhizobium pachyrhizi]|uniref:Histidine phosphatase family protein n=1 Tax=Bradyrhizobium pachyrhizi TaxID=280333 RepID=A0A844SLL3_9BRAD|nr:histidine phosphatase family protein [Bradyrhizobium pachyrhizi]MVT64949.1 histidine phosphatase family protein [Bradyrhizobium pachyrhizi]